MATLTMISRHIRSLSTVKACVQHPRVLITGGLGQLGGKLASELRYRRNELINKKLLHSVVRDRYGRDNVILSDIVKPSQSVLDKGMSTFSYTRSFLDYSFGRFKYLDVLNVSELNQVIVDNQIDWVIHFSALLSAIAEKEVQKALDINVNGLINVLQTACRHKCRLFIPSTIGAFGADSPLELTPNTCIQRPDTIYGVTKVFCELLGEYFNGRFGLDFRCLRLPGIISSDTQPGGGTTDYAVDVFHQIMKAGKYECYLGANTTLPMMYIDDCTRAIVEFMSLDPAQLKRRVYNIAAVSFNPEELFREIKTRFPKAQFSYNPDERQKIADGWPKVLDDSLARSEWKWKPRYCTKKLVDVMVDNIRSGK